MLVLITYDVNTETEAGKRRLRKVAKQCVNYGTRVQNSVFECVLDPGQCLMLKAALTELIDEKKSVCRDCGFDDAAGRLRRQTDRKRFG